MGRIVCISARGAESAVQSCFALFVSSCLFAIISQSRRREAMLLLERTATRPLIKSNQSCLSASIVQLNGHSAIISHSIGISSRYLSPCILGPTYFIQYARTKRLCLFPHTVLINTSIYLCFLHRPPCLIFPSPYAKFIESGIGDEHPEPERGTRVEQAKYGL